MMKKTCSKCGVSKAFSEFSKRSASFDGLQSQCKVCKQAQSKKYYKQNKSYFLNYCKQNKEKRNASNKRWSKSNLKKGLCGRCASKRVSCSTYYCEKHYFMHRSMFATNSHKHWQTLLAMSKNAKCALCFCCLPCPSSIHFDHILSRKKRPDLIGDITNIQVLCAKCNIAKGDR